MKRKNKQSDLSKKTLPKPSSKKEKDSQLDERLKETFPASDSTAQY